jgi:hypothetical protein
MIGNFLRSYAMGGSTRSAQPQEVNYEQDSTCALENLTNVPFNNLLVSICPFTDLIPLLLLTFV